MKVERFSQGGIRGFAYEGAPTELRERAVAWLEHGEGRGDEAIKPGRVWRSGPYAIKRFEPEAMVRLGLRASRARRNALWHSRLAPIRSPRPWIVLEQRSGASLLVSEFIEGSFLAPLITSNDAAVAAFPGFLAAMHRRGIFHGDFHLLNALWDGREWVLLDLEGLRHPLRSLGRRARAAEDWARVNTSLRGAPAVHAAFEAYRTLLPPHAAPAWSRILARSRRLAIERGIDPSFATRPPRVDGQDPRGPASFP